MPISREKYGSVSNITAQKVVTLALQCYSLRLITALHYSLTLVTLGLSRDHDNQWGDNPEATQQ
jgi:hypothetical protein